MSEHTPGPWVFDDRHIHPKSGLTYPKGAEPETDVILEVNTDCHPDGLLNETDRANLRLAAAAPEMLEALEYAATLIGTARQYFPKSIQNSDRFALENTCAAISKAIAKAKGTR